MAKRSVNKSQAIRDALAANPKASPAAIAEALKAKGLKVNAQYVSTIKSTAKAKKGGRKSVRRPKPGRAESEANAISTGLRFVSEAGGIAQAKQILATIELIQNAR